MQNENNGFKDINQISIHVVKCKRKKMEKTLFGMKPKVLSLAHKFTNALLYNNIN